MKILLAAFVIFTAGFPLSLPDSTHVDFWSWSTLKGGQKFTWLISDAAFQSLPAESPLKAGLFPLSAPAEEAVTNFAKEQMSAYAQIAGFPAGALDYRITGFGFKEIFPRYGLPDPSPNRGRWIRYLEFSAGGASLSFKVYLMPDDSILRPKIEPIPPQPSQEKTS